MNFITEGKISEVKKLKFNSVNFLNYLKKSAETPHLQLFIYLCNLQVKNFQLKDDIMNQLAVVAIKHNQLKNLKYLIRKKNMKLNDDLMNLSAEHGLKLFVTYLKDEGLSITENTVCKAIKGGDFNLVYFLLNQYGINPKHPEILLTAIKFKHLKTIEYLITQCKTLSKNTFTSCFNKFIYLKDYDSMTYLCSFINKILDN